MRAKLFGVLSLSAIVGAACGDSSTSTTTDTDAGLEVVEVILPDVEDDAIVTFDTATGGDTSTSPDASDATEDASCPGCTGAPCGDNDDCNSGYCLEGPRGRECARTCLSECPVGYGCRGIASAGGDPVFVCMYEHVTFCQPCDADADCETGTGGVSGARCVPEDEDDPTSGRFCRTPCVPGSCPEGATCEVLGDDMVCRPGGANEVGTCACSARAVSLPARTECAVVNGAGTCSGERVCSAEGEPATACDAAVPAVEACDGEDNDCDGATDEDFPSLGAACDGDDADLCAGGSWVCDGAGAMVCSDDGVTGTELCNGADDDCDGAVDEDFPTVGQACDGADADQCTDGVLACDGLGLICNDDVRSVAELCNGLDDDCDGVVDDGFDLGFACDGEGDADGCSDGRKICSRDGSTTICDDAPGGFVEACNELDDDCRNGPDDTFPDKYKACDGNDTDLCKDGVFVCSVDGLGLACSDDGISKIEVCNELDDDCDGTADEDFPQKGTACDSPVDTDSCKTGTWVCQANAIACTDDAASTVESCNGLDDDCDGQTDSADSDLTAPLNPIQLGQCAGSTQKCNGAAGFSPSYTSVPGYGLAETPDANFLDENCDGIDGDEAQAVFVKSGSADSGACTKASPCGSLTYAITQTTVAKKHVYVQAGTYTGIVEVPSGKNVEIYGGFNTNWVRRARADVGHKVTLKGAKHATEGEYMTVRVRSATVKIADLFIEGPSPGANERKDGRGLSSHAVHAVSSTVTLERVDVVAGNGANGLPGTVGLDAATVAAPAQAASGGGKIQETSVCNSSDRGAGGAGRTNGECTVGTAGGGGGNGGTMDSGCGCVGGTCGLPWCDSSCTATDGSGGSSGAGTSAGGGGSRGLGGSSCSGVGGGGSGGTPSHGAGGAGATRGGSIASNFWIGATGATGTLGSHGSGGGGGGGSGGCDSDALLQDSSGAGGGGGGAGGCAARAAGTGGGPGGLSVGLFASGGTVTVRDVRFIRGNGGAGGSGGPGGRGQSGGAGGDGGIGPGSGQPGGAGGRGGDGGVSGGGGGGAGGGAYAVFTLSSAVTVAGTTTYEGGAGGTGGNGGDAPAAGGASADGKAGQAGVVATTRICTAAAACGD